MRAVTWTDERGYRHRSLVRDEDPDELAPQGILQDPPVLDGIDWEEVRRDLHNALVDADLCTYADIQEKKGLRGAILTALRKKLVYLYRQAQEA